MLIQALQAKICFWQKLSEGITVTAKNGPSTFFLASKCATIVGLLFGAENATIVGLPLCQIFMAAPPTKMGLYEDESAPSGPE